MKILVINAGSSSLKYQLINMDNNDVLAKGLCERISIDGRLTHDTSAGKYTIEIPMPTHAEAIKAVIDTLISPEHGVIKSMSEIGAVGHRVVHGGEYFTKSVLITEDVIKTIEDCIPLAPLHNPPNLIGIKACIDVIGTKVPQVAVFDTAFHQTMPPVNYMYAIPYSYYEKYKIRRYGFHGTSHSFVSKQAAKMIGKPIESLKIITCHLGNGSSMAAIDCGKSIDTSMGFTPLGGVPMGTRSGSIDPGIISFISEMDHKSASTIIDELNTQSGVLGISGISSDFRDIAENAKQGNERCKLALDMFVNNVKKVIGGYIAVMGGLDILVFTAGVGENDIDTRGAICANMEFVGIEIDTEKNNTRGKTIDLSKPNARVKTIVMPTNEELVIAEDTLIIAKK